MYIKKWGKEFLLGEYDKDLQGTFCKVCKNHFHHCKHEMEEEAMPPLSTSTGATGTA